MPDHKKLKALYEKNLKLTKQQIKDSVNNDHFIIQTTNTLSELHKATNMLARRLREWYELYNPEFSHELRDHEKFIELILKKSKKELLGHLNIKQSMGADLSKEDLKPLLQLAAHLQENYKLKEGFEYYVEKMMKKHLPNVTAIAGALIGAKLLGLAGSSKRLSRLPASTVQLLGAEKALFRHIKTKAKPPKYGLLFVHPLVQKAPKNKQGKVARALADKISLAAKIDYFKGKFIGDKLMKELEKRFHDY